MSVSSRTAIGLAASFKRGPTTVKPTQAYPPRIARVSVLGSILLSLVAVASPVAAQDDTMTAIAAPAQPDAIPLGTGPLPDAQNAETWHSQYGSMFSRNVTEATLTPFLPDPDKASGAAVIVAPGGGIVTREENIAAMREHGVVVWLCRQLCDIIATVRQDTRPNLAGDKEERMRTLYAEREALYKKAAHISLCNTMPPEEAANEIAKLIRL